MAVSATTQTPVRPDASAGTAADRRADSRLPLLACVAAVLVAGLVMAWIGTHVTAFEYDEEHYQVSAVRYRSGLPSHFIHDLAAYATSRLYSLTLAPVFAVTDGATAVRVAKVYNSLLWCSTAIPLWLLTRGLLTPWRRAAAVTLGTIAPWMLLTTLLFTESLALPAFVWFTFAALHAVRRPAWWRDGLVMVAFVACVVARVQLAGVLAGYALLIAVGARQHIRTIKGTPWWWAARELVRYLRQYAFSCIGVLLLALYFMYLKVHGTFDREFTQLFGVYATTKDRPTLVSDGFPMVLVEVLAISFGVGVVSVLLGVPWYVRTLASRLRDDAWWYAAATLCVGAGLLAFTAYSQGSFWGPITEERYWMYTFPFIWPAAFAAAQRRTVRAGDVLIVGLVLVTIAGALGVPRVVDATSVVLAPVEGLLGSLVTHQLRPITATQRDELALLALFICGAVWLAVRRAPWLRLEWLLGVGAAIQIGFLIAGSLAVFGKVDPKVNRTGGDFAKLAWVDHAAAGDVAWFPSEPRRDPNALAVWQRLSLFWSSKVVSRVGAEGSTPQPDSGPMDTLDFHTIPVDPANGHLTAPLPTAQVVAWHDSPYQQLVGRESAPSPVAGLRVVTPSAPHRLQYRSVGLSGADGIPLGADAKLDVWPADGRAARVTLTFGSLGAGAVRITAPGAHRRVAIPATGTRTATVTVCGAHGKIKLRGLEAAKPKATDAAALDAVSVQPAPAGACAS